MTTRLVICVLLALGLSGGASALAQQVPMIDIDEDSGPVGKTAPSVPLKTLDGNDFRLESLRGKVVVLSFWASWCSPCRGEMPELDAVYASFKDKGVVVVGVNVDRDARKARAFLSTHPVTFPIVMDPDALLLGKYGVASMPTSYVIDRKGIVRKKTIGYRPEYIEDLRKLLETL